MDLFFRWLESTPLSIWIRESTELYAFPGILSLHTIGMGLVAGLSAAIALRVLGFAPGVPLKELQRISIVLWTGFWLAVVSGILLLIGYPTKALTNPVFYLKLSLVALAVVAVRRLHRGSKPWAALCLASWTGVIVAGRLLAYTYSKLISI